MQTKRVHKNYSSREFNGRNHKIHSHTLSLSIDFKFQQNSFNVNYNLLQKMFKI